MKKNPPSVKGTLLIVEDEKIIAKDIANILKKFGYVVPAIVSSGEEAIRKLEESPVDLVLMDIVLKGNLDGVEAAKQIYDRFKIPVVHLTAYADDETLDRVKETQAYGYIIKPFKERELYTAIEIALHRHKMALDQESGEDRRTEDLKIKLQRLQQFSEVKDTLFKKFLQDLSNPLQNLNVAIQLLKDSPMGPKRDHYVRIIEQEFMRQVELINQTSNLEDLLNIENVELLTQFSLLRRQDDLEKPYSYPQPMPGLSSLTPPRPVPPSDSVPFGPPPDLGYTPSRSVAAPMPAPAPTGGLSPAALADAAGWSVPPSKVAQTRPLNQTQLAERLGVVVSAITYWKFKTGFSEWSRSKDPDGIAWKYSPDSKRFSPVA